MIFKSSSILPLLSLLLPWLATTVVAQTTFQAKIRNNCGQTFRLYVNGADTGPVVPGFDVRRDIGLDTTIYTTVNGGQPNGDLTTRAVFWMEKFYYYFVKGPVTNVEVVITPNHPRSPDGLCGRIDCHPLNCAGNAFGVKQTFERDAIPVSEAPESPLRSCPFGDVVYDIEYCPNGTLPPGFHVNGQEIQLVVQGDRIWCADVRSAAFVPGTPVQLYRCNGTRAQLWIVPANGLPGPVKLAGTSFCLDTGGGPRNGARLTIQTCVPGRPSQTFVYDNTNGRYTFSTTGGQCLDNTDGRMVDWNPLQTWGCSVDNPNQRWLAFA
ncbi:ricin B-like lectin [Coprinopsis marcescibilis]|uniref:Ricin B-like lectin n=1 Tax=Coprinopsis marcescibilis TaxID=230819 RepID=A0A5C3KN72_COPMA|nr:ricin B-like lectin [Coprinopsis marcescibilis]